MKKKSEFRYKAIYTQEMYVERLVCVVFVRCAVEIG